MNAASTDSNHIGSRSSIDDIPVLMFNGIVAVMVLRSQLSSAGSILTSVPYFSVGMSRPFFLFTTAYINASK